MMQRHDETQLLKTKPHFEILNGMRGLAAFIILVFHFMEIIIPDFSRIYIAHGFMAVDFFFVLSGFVIAYAYDSRIEDMSLKTFIKLRLIRLQPLVVIGSLLGLLTFLFDPFSNLYQVYGFKETAMLFITSVLMIPYPVVSERYYNLFNLNAPSWSLFWEYVANLVYAVFLFRATKKVLSAIALIAAAALFYIAWQSGNVLGGWSGGTFFHGFARISFSFTMGMLTYRSGWIIKNRLGLPGMCTLLMLAFLVPYNEQWNMPVEPLIIIFYFPFLVALGAGAKLSHKYEKINKFSGDISYPLYMTHYPFMWVFANYFATKQPSMAQLAIIIPVCTVLLVGFAFLISEYVDLPIRQKLKAQLMKKKLTSA